MTHIGQKIAFGAIGGFSSIFGQLQGLFSAFAFGNIRANTDILIGLSRLIDKGDDGGVDPIITAIFAAVTNLASPYFTRHHGLPQLAKKDFRMVARIDHTVIFPNQLLTVITTDITEFIVGIRDIACSVSHADDGVLVEGK